MRVPSLPRIESTGWTRALAAHVLAGLGRALSRLGCHAAARRRLTVVVRLGHGSFAVHLGLARSAYALGDYTGWRRECALARARAPERFARLGHPFVLFASLDRHADRDPTATATHDVDLPIGLRRFVTGELGDRVPPFSSSSIPGLSTTDEERLASGGDPTADGRRHDDASGGFEPDYMLPTPDWVDPERAPGCDDCSSVTERERLRALGPVRHAEIAATDWAELTRRLQR
ncbi:MAG: hypothetical protein IPM29_22495 [Planctomycetes bacterium]|nr:hypothetical protein [Planctomycetota bacterium]